MRLDFSDFHPLDHSWFLCVDQPGGVRRHLSMAWDYLWQPRLMSIIGCPFGRHHMVPFWKGRSFDEDSPPDGEMCRWCWKTLD